MIICFECTIKDTGLLGQGGVESNLSRTNMEQTSHGVQVVTCIFCNLFLVFEMMVPVARMA